MTQPDQSTRDCHRDEPGLVPGNPGPQWAADARFCAWEPCGEYLNPQDQVCPWCGRDQHTLGRRRLDSAFRSPTVLRFGGAR